MSATDVRNYSPRVQLSSSAHVHKSAAGLSPSHRTSRGFSSQPRDLSFRKPTGSIKHHYRPPGTHIEPLDVSIHHRVTRHLPDRYVSTQTPHSTPLFDSHIMFGHAKLSFKKKLHRLKLDFERADVNRNGLIPALHVRNALAAANIQLPDAYVKKLISAASYNGPGKDVYWRAITLILSKINFLATDGVSEVELALIADEIRATNASTFFDAGRDGRVDASDIHRAFNAFDVDNNKHIGPKELSAVMRTLRTTRNVGNWSLAENGN